MSAYAELPKREGEEGRTAAMAGSAGACACSHSAFPTVVATHYCLIAFHLSCMPCKNMIMVVEVLKCEVTMCI